MLFQTRELLRSALMLALVVVIGSVASTAMAAPPPMPAPEIDPSSAASALAVLAGSGLILAERFGFRRK